MMRTFLSWLAIGLLGILLGVGGAICSLRSSAMADGIRVGPWSTGRNIGTADADMRTRAVVALRGLLALPASEARYFTAQHDNHGLLLDGRCTYRLSGVYMTNGPGTGYPAQWLSITVYDPDGWLIPNAMRLHSVGSAQLMPGVGGWRLWISPTAADGNMRADDSWIPTGTRGPFELTLRAYRQNPNISEAAMRNMLPEIERVGCPS